MLLNLKSFDNCSRNFTFLSLSFNFCLSEPLIESKVKKKEEHRRRVLFCFDLTREIREKGKTHKKTRKFAAANKRERERESTLIFYWFFISAVPTGTEVGLPPCCCC